MEYTNLTNEQMDVLREIGNIGAGNAATSLSKLINSKVEMQVPSVDIVGYDDLMEMLGGPDEIIVGMLFRIQGETPGTVYFILTVEEAEFLVKAIMNDDTFSLSSNPSINELAVSALSEVGNIVTGAYLSALSDFTSINMQPTVPHLSVDMAGAVLTAGLIEVSQVSDYVILINTEINRENSANDIKGNFLLMPDPESFPKLFSALGIQVNE